MDVADRIVLFSIQRHSYLQFLIEIARKKNSSVLPLIPEKFGPRLPPERYCLTANNYKILERKKTVSMDPRTSG